MPTHAREYVVGRGLGSLVDCRALLTLLPQELRAWNGESRRVTFFLRILIGPADVLDECLDPAEVERTSGGTFPVAWLNVTYDPERVQAEELEAFEARHDLRLLGTATSAVPFL